MILCLLGVGGLVNGPLAPAGADDAISFDTLEPGEARLIEQELPVNIVLLGYDEGSDPMEIVPAELLAELPEEYNPIVRVPAFYGISQSMNLRYVYDYNVVFADDTFEDAFFSYLASIAVDKPLTLFQELYNQQVARNLDVTSNAWIDAPSVEKWLATNASAALDIDTAQYTVFLVNWYGRSDFQFHVYSKTGEPDPDTGYDFGLERDSRKLIAWGGTTPDDEETPLGMLARVWFYDLSAGPEAWSANWDVDTADLDGDGVMDYRMPPVWEYGNTGGYRSFDNRSADLGKVVRFVAINLLFTPSPIYDPALSAPKLPTSIEVDLNVYQADPNADGNDWIDADYALAELSELQPLTTFSAESTDLAFKRRPADVYNCAMTFFFPQSEWQSCFGKRYFGVPLADLYLYHTDHLLNYVEGDADYEIPTFCYNLDENLFQPFLGLADDNWTDGRASYVYCLDSPGARAAGYGFTATIIHEVGHHLGMSHPHDGFDSELGIDYFPTADLFFVQSGDQCNSMMSYIDCNWDFSQFDRDNMARYLTSTYLNQSNAILPRILKSPRAFKGATELAAADAQAEAALLDFDASAWGDAAVHAKACYDLVMAAAAAANVKIEPQAAQADYKARGKSYPFLDPVSETRSLP
jgi:hypothetical protein